MVPTFESLQEPRDLLDPRVLAAIATVVLGFIVAKRTTDTTFQIDPR